MERNAERRKVFEISGDVAITAVNIILLSIIAPIFILLSDFTNIYYFICMSILFGLYIWVFHGIVKDIMKEGKVTEVAQT